MSRREAKLLLADILESIDKIEDYLSGFDFESFVNDSRTIDAVVRNLEIIGEAAIQLPDDWKAQNTQIEWYKLAGIRNRIVHAYFGIDLKIIWEIVSKDITKLGTDIKDLI